MDSKSKNSTIHKKNFTVNLPTSTREPLRITVTQVIAPNGEVALSQAVIIGRVADYLEKPDFMKRLAHKLHCAAGYMEELNENVK